MHRSRSTALVALALLALGMAGLAPTRADDEKAVVKMPAGGQAGHSRALEWLAQHQNSDGSWSEGTLPAQHRHHGVRPAGVPVAGPSPRPGAYGPEIAKGTRFLLSAAARMATWSARAAATCTATAWPPSPWPSSGA